MLLEACSLLTSLRAMYDSAPRTAVLHSDQRLRTGSISMRVAVTSAVFLRASKGRLCSAQRASR
ncbi:hypothetical protein D3C71_1767070 [compost metagenome]